MDAPDAMGGAAVHPDEAMADSQKVANQEELRLQRFRAWMQMNGVQFRGCEIRRSDDRAGFGVFASEDNARGVLIVTPLHLAITPTSVLRDPELGPYFMQLMENNEHDDRLLMILFLVIERARGQCSSWAPWLDMLPTKFGTTIWFSEEEFLELKGTHLFQATKIQLNSLKLAFETTAKPFADTVLSCVGSERREVVFQDFLWANSIFWTRAKSIPCPHSIVFPAECPVPPAPRGLQSGNASTGLQFDEAISGTTDFQIGRSSVETCSSNENTLFDLEDELAPCPSLADENDMGNAPTDQLDGAISETTDFQIATDHMETGSEYELVPCPSLADEDDMAGNEASAHRVEAPSDADNEGVVKPSSVMVEGLVPGIDFCNHDRLAAALWEVDGPEGSVTGVPNSMYLVSLRPQLGIPYGEEIFISYGPKGNEELIFLYGFVLEDNPDDYLMIHFPAQALEDSDCSDTKKQLLKQLGLPLRWLVPSSKLRWGFYEELNLEWIPKIPLERIVTGHSWSGHRKTSPLANKVVFPEDLLTALRIAAMEENEVYRVFYMLEDISDPEAGRIPTDADIRAAVWEVCGNTGAFQLLIDLLTSELPPVDQLVTQMGGSLMVLVYYNIYASRCVQFRSMLALKEGTGTDAMDSELLAKDSIARSQIKEQSHSDRASEGDERSDCNLLSDKKRAAVIYRMGQKRLVRGFLQEAEMALEVCLDYVSSD